VTPLSPSLLVLSESGWWEQRPGTDSAVAQSLIHFHVGANLRAGAVILFPLWTEVAYSRIFPRWNACRISSLVFLCGWQRCGSAKIPPERNLGDYSVLCRKGCAPDMHRRLQSYTREVVVRSKRQSAVCENRTRQARR
jgi:hypothetical protein